MRRQFTLLEILISTTILIIIGLMLVGLIRQSLGIYQQAESRRQQYQDIQQLQELLREDVSHLFTQENDLSTLNRVSFLTTIHPSDSRQRICFTRTIKEEQTDPILRNAGTKAVEEGWADVYTMNHDQEKKLRAPGGIAEVFYVLGEKDTLYRGVRSPVGGRKSWTQPKFYQQSLRKIQKLCQPVCGRILYFGAKYWGPKTNTWDNQVSARSGGPHLLWDSTRGRLKDFYYFKNFKSENAFKDDIFPQKIQFLIILDADPPNKISTQLTRPVGARDLIIPVQSTQKFNLPSDGPCYIKIENEWMSVKSVEPFQFTVKKRGVLGTKAESHNVKTSPKSTGYSKKVTTMVRQGIHFLLTYQVPTHQLRFD